MKNNFKFTDKTRELFDLGGWMEDWEDGQNNADCLHHIMGRVSRSPLNAAPLNNFRNHQPEGRKNLPAITAFEVRSKYLKKTRDYLMSIGYQLTKDDENFLVQHIRFYN